MMITTFFLEWAAMYAANQEFAKLCDEFIDKLAEAKNKNKAEMPKVKTQKENMREQFELRVDRLCLVISIMKEGKSANKVKGAMMHIYDRDVTGAWFAPRSCRESFNEQNFCRVIHHIHNNKFLIGVKWHNKELSVLAMANMLAGNIFEDASDAEGRNYAVFEGSDLKVSTLRTYLSRDSLCKGFESECSNLNPDNYDD